MARNVKNSIRSQNAEAARSRMRELQKETQQILRVEKDDRERERSSVFRRVVRAIAVP